MHDILTMAAIWCSVLLMCAGCATTENGAPKGGADASEPGTQAFYEQNIRGKYALDGDVLVPIRGMTPAASGAVPPDSSSGLYPPAPPMPPAIPGIVRAGPFNTPIASAQIVEGRVLQVLSNNLVVVGQPVTNISGAVAFPRTQIVSLAGGRQTPAEGASVRLLAVLAGFRTCLKPDGTISRLAARREVLEPTYAEYRRVYERDCRTVQADRIVSIQPAASVAPVIPRPPVPSPQASQSVQDAVLAPAVSLPFTYTVTNDTVTILKYQGTGGAVTIPGAIAGHPVSAIGRSAFQDCRSMTAIAIPDAVKTIESDAFRNCSSLTNVTLCAGVTGIGDAAFLGCTNLPRLFIPASVTQIGGNAFENCPALASILVDVLNPVYSSSADGVLFNVDKTRLLRYPQARAGSYAIPRRVTSVGGWAFRDCTGLTDVTIPNGVASIEGGAFWGCSALTHVTIPASVSSLAVNSFSFCTRLNSITVDDANLVYISSEDGVVFNKEKTGLVRYPAGKPGDYAIPTRVTQIQGGAFEGSAGLTAVTIPNGITSIEGFTFNGCTNLADVTIPNSVSSIGGWAFIDCRKLARVTIPDSVRRIDTSAFARCTSLTSITIPDTVTSIGDWVFADCGLTDFAFLSNSNITSTGAATLQGCTNLVSVTIPDNVTKIGQQVFYNCNNLINVTIPKGVTSMDYLAFGGCSRLASVYFKGDAPTNDWTVFCGAGKATLYYLPGTTGWGKEFGGRPTAVWDGKAQGE